MNKNLLILEGSPRKKGNSTVLHGLKISPCNNCDLCKGDVDFCVLKDDMQTIYPKILAADGVLFATPIYWFTFTAQLKLCIDRWYGLWNQQPDFLRSKPVGVILTFGDPDLYSSGAINAVHTFESMFRYTGSEIAGWVFASLSDVGDAQKHPELLESASALGKKFAAMLENR
jgi:multimeric flavodoxin WrbA